MLVVVNYEGALLVIHKFCSQVVYDSVSRYDDMAICLCFLTGAVGKFYAGGHGLSRWLCAAFAHLSD